MNNNFPLFGMGNPRDYLARARAAAAQAPPQRGLVHQPARSAINSPLAARPQAVDPVIAANFARGMAAHRDAVAAASRQPTRPGRKADCGCNNKQPLNWLDGRSRNSDYPLPSIIVVSDGMVVSSAMSSGTTSVDFESIGSKSELLAAIKDVNRNGAFIDSGDAATVVVSGSTVTITAGTVAPDNSLIGFRTSFASAAERVKRQTLGLRTAGFASAGLGVLDRRFSNYSLRLHDFEIYVLFATYGRTPQDAHLKIAKGIDDTATAVFTGVSSDYSDGITFDWISADSPALKALADVL